MGKTLIIAEKPSVAADIVKALPGTFTRTKTHFESDRYIVSFALGHLVSIAYPEEIDPRYQKWTIDNLPILPDEFPLTVLPETKSQFNALRKLIRGRDIDVIINACDAGREGELIFYRRADQQGPKESFYLRSPTSAPDTLRQSLSLAYGQVGRVRKRRLLFLAGRTRIHLDQVESLGDFLELEVVLEDGEPAEAGVLEADNLMSQLDIARSQLIEAAYVDLLRSKT